MDHVIKKFTPEDLERLRANPFTYRAEENRLSFTKKFKELFWKRYTLNHESSYTIFGDCGYEIGLVGHTRIDNFTRSIKQEYVEFQVFHDGSRADWHVQEKKPDAAAAGSSDQDSKDKQIEDLQSRFKAISLRLEYVEQELEFVKKTFSAIVSKKP